MVRKSEKRYIIGGIGSHKIAFPIKNTKEILQASKYSIREIPRQNKNIKGFLQLREEELPIVDLRPFFSKTGPVKEYETCIIVVRYKKTSIGFILDRAENLVSLSDLQSLPSGTLMPFTPDEITAPFVNEIISVAPKDEGGEVSLIHFLDLENLYLYLKLPS